MFRCATCWTAFVFPTPSDVFLAEYYDRFHQASGVFAAFEGRVAADFAAKLHIIKSCLSQGGSRNRLLDIGCARGDFLAVAAAEGFEVEGVDLSKSGIEAARGRGFIVHQGAIERLESQIGEFDAVTFWATIEHLPRPLETLSSIRRVLRPGGVLAFDTGIGYDFLDRCLPGRTQWYDPPQHLFVFSERGIRLLLERAGFEVISIDRCFERTLFRRLIRQIRSVAAATLFALLWSAMLFTRRSPGFTRFPIGNLMLITARAV
jgi:SAM-dependent methyltransferase